MPFTAELQELVGEVHGLRDELTHAQGSRARERVLVKRVVAALVIALVAVLLTGVVTAAATVYVRQEFCQTINSGRAGSRAAFDGYTDALVAVADPSPEVEAQFRALQEANLSPLQTLDCGFFGSSGVPWWAWGTVTVFVAVVVTAMVLVRRWFRELRDEDAFTVATP